MQRSFVVILLCNAMLHFPMDVNVMTENSTYLKTDSFSPVNFLGSESISRHLFIWEEQGPRDPPP